MPFLKKKNLLCFIIFILEVFLEFDSVKVNVMSKLMLIGVSGFRFHLCVKHFPQVDELRNTFFTILLASDDGIPKRLSISVP